MICKVAKDLGVLTVAVVTRPFEFEGEYRKRVANKGIEELKPCVDTLLVIPNEKLLKRTTATTTLVEAFKEVDGVITNSVRSVVELIEMSGKL